MKTDSELQRDVLEELAWEPSIKAEEIGVTVQGGVVTLSGNVPTYAEKNLAEHATKRVSGVRAVAEQLTVKLANSNERNDSDIAQTVVNALDWNVSVPEGTVKAVVENGWITLSGDVEWNYQRESAHNAVRHLMGVVGVSNQIQIKPLLVSTVEVRNKIESALNRNMLKNVKGITILASHGKVTLSGTVQSWEEYDDAGSAAWSAPGVLAVENNLTVTY